MKRKLFVCISLILCMNMLLIGCTHDSENNSELQTGINEEEISKEVSNGSTDESVGEEEKPLLTGFSTTYTIEDFKDGYFIVSMQDGLNCALLDMSGNEVIPFGQAVTMSFPQSKSAEAVIVVNGKTGLMDYSGNEILPIEYDSISNWGYNSEYYLAEKDGAQSIIGMDGDIVQELSGSYGGIISNSFLIDGEVGISSYGYYDYIYGEGNRYSFDEELIDESGNICLTAYSLNNYYYRNDFSNGNTAMAFLNIDGDIVFTLPGYEESDEEWYQDFESIDIGNLLSVAYYPPGVTRSNYYKLVNPDRKTVSEQYYKQIIKANDSTIYALQVENDAIDIYDENGEYLDTLEFDSSFISIGDNNSLVASLTANIEFFNDEGVAVLEQSDVCNLAPVENYWVLVNTSGEYALMDETGKIRIPYGQLRGTSSTEWADVELESYNGEAIDAIYTFGDVFCIVTLNDSGSNVYLF